MPSVFKPHVLLAEPRGFCAGVESAVKSLAWMVVLHRPPVVCVHAVVHNEDVVERFERLGVRFVDDPDEAPPDLPLVLSAHGSAPDTVERARRRASVMVDAVCPLVTKVHHEIRTRARAGGSVVYVGHPGHDEAVGAIAQAPESVVRVATAQDVGTAVVPDGAPVAVLAQTTLAHDAWRDVVAAARRRFGEVWLPPRDDLCFATTNRQAAVRALAAWCDAVVVVGSPTSSNTRALADTARRAGCPRVVRVAGPSALPVDLLRPVSAVRPVVVGVTAGASTPARAVDGVVEALSPKHVDRLEVTREDEYFPLARPVRQRLRDLARRGWLPPTLHDAFVNDRTTRADDLLGRIEADGLVAALAVGPAAPLAREGPAATAPDTVASTRPDSAGPAGRRRAGRLIGRGDPVRWAS
jgi:4-hydroxy-3-methylbut-2-en-1-yl diphosphate reductase